MMKDRLKNAIPIIFLTAGLVLIFGTAALSGPAAGSDGLGRIPAVFVALPFGQPGGNYALVVEKSTQQLMVYAFRNDGGVEETARFKCSTGEVSGRKERSGDKKTPEGVYFITRRFLQRDLTPIYGTRAFPLDYPNLLDKLAGRTGYSIWLHGTDKPLQPRNSNGCIVFQNRDIEEIEQYITLNKTPVIVVERLAWQSRDAFLEKKEPVLDFLSNWNTTMEAHAFTDVAEFYNPDAVSGVLEWWADWERASALLQASGTVPSIEIENIAVFRYQDIYVALFDQVIRWKDRKVAVGTRKLFLKNADDRLSIMADTFQPGDKTETHPFLTACRNLAGAVQQAARFN